MVVGSRGRLALVLRGGRGGQITGGAIAAGLCLSLRRGLKDLRPPSIARRREGGPVALDGGG